MAKRQARLEGGTSRPWKRSTTYALERERQNEARRRGAEYTRERNACKTVRDRFLVDLRGLRKLWEAFGNPAIIWGALRLCAQADACPAWVAEAAVEMMEAAALDKRRNPLARWRRRYERDLIDLVRHDELAEGRTKGGLSWEQAAAFAADSLIGTIFHAASAGMLASYKRVERWERENKPAGRYYTGWDFAAWYDGHRPTTQVVTDAFAKWRPFFRRGVDGEESEWNRKCR